MIDSPQRHSRDFFFSPRLCAAVNVLVLILFILSLPVRSRAETDVTVNLYSILNPLSGINNLTNRECLVEDLGTPGIFGAYTTIGDATAFWTDTNASFTVSNCPASTFLVTVLGNPGRRMTFQFTVTSTNLGAINANVNTSVSGAPTSPAGGVAWTIGASDARYGLSTNVLGSAAFLPAATFQPASVNLTNWSALGTNSLVSTNALIALSNALISVNAAYATNATNYANTISNSLAAFTLAIGASGTNNVVAVSNALYTALTGAASANTNYTTASSNALYSALLTLGASGTNNATAVSNGLVTLVLQLGTATTNNLFTATNALWPALAAQATALNNSLAAASNTLSSALGSLGTAATNNLNSASNALVTAQLAQGVSLTNAINGASNALVTAQLAQGVTVTNAINSTSNVLWLLSGLYSTNATNFALALSATATNNLNSASNALYTLIGTGGSGGGVSTNYVTTVSNALVLSIGLTSTNATNYANSISNSLWLITGLASTNATNFTLSTSNGLYSLLGTYGTNATNLSATVSNAAVLLASTLSTNGTNFTLSASNSLATLIASVGAAATNLNSATSNALWLLSGLYSTNATNFGNAIGLAATNYANAIGVNFTNSLNASSNVLWLLSGLYSTNATNFALGLSTNATNYANAVSNAVATLAQTLGSGNATAIATASNTLYAAFLSLSSVTNTYALNLNGTITNLTLKGTNTLGGVNVFPEWSNSSLTSGNNADVSRGTNNVIRVTGPTAAFAIAGFSGGIAGEPLIVINSTVYPMTLLNNSGVDGTPANRLQLDGTTNNVTLAPGYSTASFVYDGSAQKWALTGFTTSVTNLFNTNFVSLADNRPLTLTNSANVFAGDGSGFTNLNASNLVGLNGTVFVPTANGFATNTFLKNPMMQGMILRPTNTYFVTNIISGKQYSNVWTINNAAAATNFHAGMQFNTPDNQQFFVIKMLNSTNVLTTAPPFYNSYTNVTAFISPNAAENSDDTQFVYNIGSVIEGDGSIGIVGGFDNSTGQLDFFADKNTMWWTMANCDYPGNDSAARLALRNIYNEEILSINVHAASLAFQITSNSITYAGFGFQTPAFVYSSTASITNVASIGTVNAGVATVTNALTSGSIVNTGAFSSDGGAVQTDGAGNLNVAGQLTVGSPAYFNGGVTVQLADLELLSGATINLNGQAIHGGPGSFTDLSFSGAFTGGAAQVNTLTVTNGISTLTSNLLAPASITAPLTTVNYTNVTGRNMFYFIDFSGVTVSSVKVNGTQVFSSVAGDVTVPLQPNETFNLTYSGSTPVIHSKPY